MGNLPAMDVPMRPATLLARRRRWWRVLLPACLGLVIPCGGCSGPTVEVSAQQPIAFPHRAHLEYFTSGRHRQERIELHLTILGLTEAPPELAEGRCVDCHGEALAEKTACAGCHTLFQDATLRIRQDVRDCIGCHRGAWNGSRATIPSTTVCVTCHADSTVDTFTDATAEQELRADLARTEDVPWVQINTVPDHVYFSHPAHVRFNKMTCTTCHADVRKLVAPPTTASVFAMPDCLKCHAEHQASNACLTCHK
jgi:hypothetical protein